VLLAIGAVLADAILCESSIISTMAVFAATPVGCWLQGTLMALFNLLLLRFGKQRDGQCVVLSSTHDCLVAVVVRQANGPLLPQYEKFACYGTYI
jgi:hypothetical protein